MGNKVVWGMLALACMAGNAWALPWGQVVLEGPKGEKVFVQAEVAADAPAREVGLMNRKALADGMGMLFMWDEPMPVAMWMKNTLIPLDMVFAREGRVVGVVAWARPGDLTPLSPGGEFSDRVLEVPGGFAAKRGITVGWRLRELP